MNCKHCGAPLHVGDEACTYCGSPTALGVANQQKRLEQEKKAALLPMKAVGPGMIICLCLVTIGLYSPIWYLLRKKSLERLSPHNRLSPFLLWLYLAVSVAFIVFPQLPKEEIREALGLEVHEHIFTVLMLLMPGLSIWLAFQTQRMLQNYASAFMERKMVINTVASSGLALVFFGVIYLQLQINKMIDMEILNPELSTSVHSLRKRR